MDGGTAGSVGVVGTASIEHYDANNNLIYRGNNIGELIYYRGKKELDTITRDKIDIDLGRVRAKLLGLCVHHWSSMSPYVNVATLSYYTTDDVHRLLGNAVWHQNETGNEIRLALPQEPDSAEKILKDLIAACESPHLTPWLKKFKDRIENLKK